MKFRVGNVVPERLPARDPICFAVTIFNILQSAGYTCACAWACLLARAENEPG